MLGVVQAAPVTRRVLRAKRPTRAPVVEASSTSSEDEEGSSAARQGPERDANGAKNALVDEDRGKDCDESSDEEEECEAGAENVTSPLEVAGRGPEAGKAVRGRRAAKPASSEVSQVRRALQENRIA